MRWRNFKWLNLNWVVRGERGWCCDTGRIMGLKSWEPTFSVAPRINRTPQGYWNSECHGGTKTQSEVKELKEDVRGCPPNKLFYWGITHRVKCMNLRCIFCLIFIYEHIHGSTSHIKIQNISNISKCSFVVLSLNTFWEYGKGAGLEQA